MSKSARKHNEQKRKKIKMSKKWAKNKEWAKPQENENLSKQNERNGVHIFIEY